MTPHTDPSSSSMAGLLDDEPILPHVSPPTHAISPEDYNAYNDIVAFHEELLTFTPTGEESSSILHRRWLAFSARIDALIGQQRLSQITIDLYLVVLEVSEAMMEASMEDDDNLAIVCQDLVLRLKRTFEEDASQARPPKAKKAKIAPAPKPKPFLQPKRFPTNFQKTHRKRRIESGIPGQESLKFRPCRDFFMDHLSDPYPNATQKADLMKRAGIASTQLNQWFTNTRRRSNWMDIMKNHANGRKEDMRVLVERALSPSERASLRDDIYDAIMKMRKYVDELAREVVSSDFMEALEGLQSMTEKDALQWQEQVRQERKKNALIKRELGSPSLSREDSIGHLRLGDKRKRPMSSEDNLSVKVHREASWSASPRPVKPIAVSKKPRVTTDTEDEPHVPPKDLYRRRLGVPDLAAPLSASSTFVGSDIADTPSSAMSRSSPLPLPHSPSNLVARMPPDNLQTGSDSLVVTITVPSAEATVNPSELHVDTSHRATTSPGSGNMNPGIDCAEWLKTLSRPISLGVSSPEHALQLMSTTVFDEKLQQFWDGFDLDSPSPVESSPTSSLPGRSTRPPSPPPSPSYAMHASSVPTSSAFAPRHTAEDGRNYVSGYEGYSNQEPQSATPLNSHMPSPYAPSFEHYPPTSYSQYGPSPIVSSVEQNYTATPTYTAAYGQVHHNPPQDHGIAIQSHAMKPEPYAQAWDTVPHVDYDHYGGDSTMTTQERYIQPITSMATLQPMYYAS